jgi:hypothetical protein
MPNRNSLGWMSQSNYSPTDSWYYDQLADLQLKRGLSGAAATGEMFGMIGAAPMQVLDKKMAYDREVSQQEYYQTVQDRQKHILEREQRAFNTENALNQVTSNFMSPIDEGNPRAGTSIDYSTAIGHIEGMDNAGFQEAFGPGVFRSDLLAAMREGEQTQNQTLLSDHIARSEALANATANAGTQFEQILNMSPDAQYLAYTRARPQLLEQIRQLEEIGVGGAAEMASGLKEFTWDEWSAPYHDGVQSHAKSAGQMFLENASKFGMTRAQMASDASAEAQRVRDMNTFLTVGNPEDLGVDAIAQLDARIRQTLGPRIIKAESQDDVEKAFKDLNLYGKRIPKDMVERYREEIGTYSPDDDWSERVEAVLRVDAKDVGTQWEFYSKALGYSSAPNLMSVDGLRVALEFHRAGDSSYLETYENTRAKEQELTGNAQRSQVTPEDVAKMTGIVDGLEESRAEQEAFFEKDGKWIQDASGRDAYRDKVGDVVPVEHNWDERNNSELELIEISYNLPPEQAIKQDFLSYLRSVASPDEFNRAVSSEEIADIYEDYIGSQEMRTPRRGDPFAWDKLKLIQGYRERLGITHPEWLLKIGPDELR